ncbi:MAG: ABC-2 family transporter protein [Pseudomonadota bacterium]
MRQLLCRHAVFTAAMLQARLSYRSGFLLVIVSSAIGLLAQWFLWRAIYGSDPQRVLAGFRLHEMVSYLLAAQLVHQLIDNRVEHEIAADVLRGDIVVSFVRPLHYTLQKFFASLGVVAANGLMVAVPLAAGGALLMDLALPAWHQAALFALSTALSIVIAFLLNAMLGAAAFVTSNIWGLQTMKDALLAIFSGHLIPLSFFGPGWQQAAECLPFQAMVYAPVTLLLGKVQGAEAVLRVLGQQALWVSVLSAACALVWRAAGRRLEAVGG